MVIFRLSVAAAVAAAAAIINAASLASQIHLSSLLISRSAEEEEAKAKQAAQFSAEA